MLAYYLLGLGLALHQGGGDGGAGLGNVEAPDEGGRGLDEALVLVAPDHQVHPVGDHGLVHAVLGAAAVVPLFR